MTIQQPPLHVFCSYAHEDKELFRKLNVALAVLRRQKAISIWHYGELLPGTPWEQKIEQELTKADIILLLISPAFMDSDYCYRKEMQWALLRHSTGEARVIPIILKPTDWKTTPLSELQALPKNIKPITTWTKRAEAFDEVVNGLRNVIEAVLHEDRYPVKEYLMQIPIYAYGRFQQDIPAQDEVIHQQAEQWLETISQIKILQNGTEGDQKKTWIVTDNQQDCHITIPCNSNSLNGFRSIELLLTSKYLNLLDQLIEAGRLPYRVVQWTLLDNLDIVALGKQIYEQRGTSYTSSTQAGDSYHVEYKLYGSDVLRTVLNPIRVTFTSQNKSATGGPSFPARVCLIHDNPPFRGFYHAHKLFSTQKIISLLCGKLPYKEIEQLIDEACTL